MSSRPLERQRLYPALLDRLRDDAPADQHAEAPEARFINKQQLREAVLRDLTWLMNSVQPGQLDGARYPCAAASVINFGLPPMSGGQASSLHVGALEAAIRQAIIVFEPRILPDTLQVKALESEAVLDSHNVIQIEIRGFLWAQPLPLEILIRTQLDLETGQTVVREGA
jgi:type VI secretion system protein ImpF